MSPELEDPFVRRFLREEVVAAVPTVPAPTVPALTAPAPTVPALASRSDFTAHSAPPMAAHNRSLTHSLTYSLTHSQLEALPQQVRLFHAAR